MTAASGRVPGIAMVTKWLFPAAAGMTSTLSPFSSEPKSAVGDAEVATMSRAALEAPCSLSHRC
jgi:hypothetical protein